MNIRYLILSMWMFRFISSCSDKDGNLIHEFSELVGEETFSIVTNVLESATEFGIIAGEAIGQPVIMLASGVAKLGLGWCLKNFEDDKIKNMVTALNEQLKLLEIRLLDRIDALQIMIHKIDLKNTIIYPAKNGLDRIITFQTEQSPSSLRMLKHFCLTHAPHESLKNLADKLKEADIGKQVILNSDYDGRVYLPFRNEIDETIKTLLILIGYCETVTERWNITNNHHYIIANRSLSRLHEQISSDDSFIKHGFWPSSINNTVIQILKKGEQNSNLYVKELISRTLRSKYPWTNFTVIVYDPITGYDKHLLVSASVKKHILHYFRFAGKNCIIFQSPYDENIKHKKFSENFQSTRQLACDRMNTLYDMYSVFSNKSTTNENTNENNIVSISLDREELCHMKKFIPSMCTSENNFEIMEKLQSHRVTIFQVLVASDANARFELEGGTFNAFVGQSCKKGSYYWFFYSYVPEQKYLDYLLRKSSSGRKF